MTGGARLRLDGQLMHVITQDGVLWRALPCPIPPGQRHRLHGVRLAGPGPLPEAAPTAQRRVSSRGGIQVAHQKIQVGMTDAGKIVTVVAENNTFRLVIDGETVAVVPRTTSHEIGRYMAYATHPRRRPTSRRSTRATPPNSPKCCNSSASGWPATLTASPHRWKNSSATPPTG